ncbi:hypothetical protein C9374_000894 [Naegleria lovaniensis]|uniref:Myb-like domain-containing protein n=1 Tax=Naegleria lovaniensis TaxID=51637 RepID=A0AA88KNI0_NAELO|nr:uncharacterized protein C9374_000894 [Naegleria lovaniensis]KAG2388044.1 hypothetical protein C9374_000894 [Naegleria lovaniensis]
MSHSNSSSLDRLSSSGAGSSFTLPMSSSTTTSSPSDDHHHQHSLLLHSTTSTTTTATTTDPTSTTMDKKSSSSSTPLRNNNNKQKRSKKSSSSPQDENDDKKKKKKMTLSKEQDMMLIEAVRQYTESNNPIQWKEINRKLFNNQYTSNFLYQRYHRTLNAKKHRWSDEEDLELLHYCIKHDKKWSLIAQKEYEGFFPDIQLSNRYKNVCKRNELKERLASMTEKEIEDLIERNKQARTKSLDTRNLVKVIEDSAEPSASPSIDASKAKRKSNSPSSSSKKTKYQQIESSSASPRMESDDSIELEVDEGDSHDSFGKQDDNSTNTFLVELESIRHWPQNKIEEEYWKKVELIKIHHMPLLVDLLHDCEKSIEALNESMLAILQSTQNASLKLKQVEENMDLKNGWQKLYEDCRLLRDIIHQGVDTQINPITVDSFTFLCRAECCLCSYRERLRQMREMK